MPQLVTDFLLRIHFALLPLWSSVSAPSNAASLRETGDSGFVIIIPFEPAHSGTSPFGDSQPLAHSHCGSFAHEVTFIRSNELFLRLLGVFATSAEFRI